MAPTRRMTRTAAREMQPSPRPRRKAAVRAAAAASPARKPGAWTDETGTALEGASVAVWWPSDERYYDAVVLAYMPRRRAHKIIYLEDETVEFVELGDGPDQRAWHRAEEPADPLIGKDLVFLRGADDDDGEPAWFDFMRGSREKRNREFVVKVFAKLTSEPDPDEVCSPIPRATDEDEIVAHKYYRVIYLANEFLATVDLANIEYRVVEEEGDDPDSTIDLVSPPQNRSALPPDSRRPAGKAAAPSAGEAAGPEGAGGDDDEDEDKDDDDAYVPPAEDADETDDDKPQEDQRADRDGRAAARRPIDVMDDADEDAPARGDKPDGKKVDVQPKDDKPDEEMPDATLEVKPEGKAEDKPKAKRDVKTDQEKSDEKKPEDKPDADKVEEDVLMDDEQESAPVPSAADMEYRPPKQEADGEGKTGAVKQKTVSRAPLTKDVFTPSEKERRSKVVTVDRATEVDTDPTSDLAVDKPATRVHVTPDDSVNVASLEQEQERADAAAAKVKGECSVGTQDTRDDPLDRSGTQKEKKSRAPPPVPAALYPTVFKDEEENHDTASDEEKLGWIPGNQKKPPSRYTTTKSQVGDYISLDTGNGKERRKAFVEAYLPATDKHFVAFCDAEGGNLQIKLAKANHTVLKDEEVDALSRSQITTSDPDAGAGEGHAPKPRTKRRRNSSSLTLQDTKSKKRRESRPPEIKGNTAGAEICGRCLKIVWPGSDLVYTALVLGYNSETKQHLVVYLSDHCVETLELQYREWNLLAREDEPWITQGMVGKRLYVFWDGEYDDEKAHALSRKIFGEETKVAYEAYVLSYEGEGSYKILYPATEDTETRELKVDGPDDVEATAKEWDIIEQGKEEVEGLPVLTWSV